MEVKWKRPKCIPSKTTKIPTSCGNLHLTFGYEEERLIEVRPSIGKNGICPNVLLDAFCKSMSMYLQSPEPRYKIIEKFKKQFVEMNCGEPFTWEGDNYTGCHDLIVKCIVTELEKQIGG